MMIIMVMMPMVMITAIVVVADMMTYAHDCDDDDVVVALPFEDHKSNRQCRRDRLPCTVCRAYEARKINSNHQSRRLHPLRARGDALQSIASLVRRDWPSASVF